MVGRAAAGGGVEQVVMAMGGIEPSAVGAGSRQRGIQQRQFQQHGRRVIRIRDARPPGVRVRAAAECPDLAQLYHTFSNPRPRRTSATRSVM